MGGLEIRYQPEVDLHTGLYIGVESLVRFPHSPLGTLAPDEFVEVAERSGQIHDLGRFVLGTALADTQSWMPLDPDHPKLITAVNVSPQELLRVGFATDVVATLEHAGFDPGRLCIEVTETAVVEAVDAVVRVMRELRAAGVLLAIDDFGTGHASLRHLVHFPADIVKIDRSFVGGLSQDQAAEVIVESIIEMAHALDKQVVAEGVETTAQLERLLELGCDVVQGYLFARPLPIEEARTALAGIAQWPVELTGRRTQRRARGGTEPSDPALRYRLLIDASRSISASTTLEQVLDSTFAALRQLVKFTGGSIQLVQDTHLALAATDPPATPEALGARVPLGQGVGGTIAATGVPRYLADITIDADVPASRRKASVSGGVRSYFGVPLMNRGEVLGLLQIDSTVVDAFSVDDQTLVLAIAPVVAAALTQVDQL